MFRKEMPTLPVAEPHFSDGGVTAALGTFGT